MHTDPPIPAENPPAYESAIVGPSTGMSRHASRSGTGRGDASIIRFLVLPPVKGASPQDTQPKGPPLMQAGGPQLVYGATSSEPTVYYYQDPLTGQRVASLLPPDHPKMVCLQAGTHVPETRYGCLGASSFHVRCVWAHAYDGCIVRCDRGNYMVPPWHRPMSARSPRPMRTLRRLT
jgi:hypothetical protein